MKTFILFALFFFIAGIKCKSQDFIKVYNFGDYRVETGFCKSNTSLKIYKQNKIVYSDCSGDGVGYFLVNTMYLNNDNVPDFIFGYKMEDYSLVGLLLSKNTSPFYGSIDIKEIFDPLTYGNIKISKNETIKPLILRDIDNDGRKDILINIIENNNNKSVKVIKGFTDTISYIKLKRFLSKNAIK
jgi:hypothetical protein